MTDLHADSPAEWMAREACRDFGYTFLALADDMGNELPVAGFTYIEPNQDRAAPNWVSLRKACYNHWDGRPE